MFYFKQLHWTAESNMCVCKCAIAMKLRENSWFYLFSFRGFFLSLSELNEDFLTYMAFSLYTNIILCLTSTKYNSKLKSNSAENKYIKRAVYWIRERGGEGKSIYLLCANPLQLMSLFFRPSIPPPPIKPLLILLPSLNFLL